MVEAPQHSMIIADDNTIVRYCKPLTLDPKSKRILALAFARKKDEQTVSVNDLDMAPGDTQQVRLAVTKRMILMTLSQNGKFALVPVNSVRRVKASPALDVIHDPDEKGGRRNDAHCGITNAPTEEDLSHSVLLALRDSIVGECFVKDT